MALRRCAIPKFALPWGCMTQSLPGQRLVHDGMFTGHAGLPLIVVDDAASRLFDGA